MSALLEKIRRNVSKLSAEERQRLTTDLVKAVCECPECDPVDKMEMAWGEELRKRLLSSNSGRMDMISWTKTNMSMSTGWGEKRPRLRP